MIYSCKMIFKMVYFKKEKYMEEGAVVLVSLALCVGVLFISLFEKEREKRKHTVTSLKWQSIQFE